MYTVTVYEHIRRHTLIYDRIRQSYSSVYGIENFTFKSLRIFIPSPYTDLVHDLRISLFFFLNGRLRSWVFDLGNVVLLGTSKRFGSNQLSSNQQLLDMIGPIDPPLQYDDLNLDKCHLKSSLTATAHAVSETGVRAEFLEKLESSGISAINRAFV